MKVAILASGSGEKARHLHNFFKEGNRVKVEVLLTDNEDAPIKHFFDQEGIDVLMLTDSTEEDYERLAGSLRDSGVEMIVVDGFDDEVPYALKKEYGEAIVYPTGVQETPVEIIEAVKRQKKTEEEKAEAVEVVEKAEPVAPEGEAETLEDEWAKALNVERRPPQVNFPEPPQVEGPEPPREYVAPPVQPRSPQYQPQYQPQQEPPAEPMPDTYLVWAVIITILCCLIPGIVAIVFASSVSSKYYAGDIEGAKRASRNAQIWIIVSVVAGIIWGTLYLPIMLLAG